MGGLPPLGYNVEDRKLVVNGCEADNVRDIFRRYPIIKSVRALKVELDQDSIVSKARLDRFGNAACRLPAVLSISCCKTEFTAARSCTRLTPTKAVSVSSKAA